MDVSVEPGEWRPSPSFGDAPMLAMGGGQMRRSGRAFGVASNGSGNGNGTGAGAKRSTRGEGGGEGGDAVDELHFNDEGEMLRGSVQMQSRQDSQGRQGSRGGHGVVDKGGDEEESLDESLEEGEM